MYAEMAPSDPNRSEPIALDESGVGLVHSGERGIKFGLG